MSDQATDIECPAPNVAFRQHAVAAVLILGFVVAGWMRLNDCDLFNPDSPRYLIYGQSIAETGQYRAIDTPGAPLYTWRPPGLPFLLAPVLKFRPYDVVAAKCVVLGMASALLWVVHLMASRRAPWCGPLMVAVVGSSPMFLSLSTEVLTEVPYALGILAALYWIGRWNEQNSAPSQQASAGGAYFSAFLVLGFTPILRTVGVALIAAVGLWCLTSLRRCRFLPAVAFGLAGIGWLAWRSRHAPASNYAGSLFQSIRDHGLPTVLANMWATISYYASAFPGVLLPGFTTDQPLYAPMVVGSLPSISGLRGFAASTALIVVMLGLVGMWQQRSRSGIVALLYVPLYGACLAIWPWRHERFLWPLVPMIWAFVPAGALLLARRWPNWLKRTVAPVFVSALLALVAWQGWGDASLIGTNQRYYRDPTAFIQNEAPSFYFSGWRKAGDWIRENTPTNVRLLAWQAAVGGTAHRFQRRAQFEAMTPDKIHQQIASFSARYLVVNDSQFGLGFGWQQLSGDPAYQFKIVYRDRNAAVLEVEPNRNGTVSRTAYAEWVAEQRSSLEAVLTRFPNRLDLLARKADLLQDVGENEQAIELLEGLVSRGMVTVRVLSALGWLYFDEQRYELAAKYLDMAGGLPNAEQLADSLSEGARQAREQLHQPATNSNEAAAERSLRRVQGLASSQHLARAEVEVQRLLELAPDHAAANYWRGYLHHLFGETAEAEARYVRALELGSDAARGKLLLLRLAKAVEQNSATVINLDGASDPVDPNTASSHLRLATMLDEHGWSGRALAVLEAARIRFGDQPEILSKLADLYMRFAQPEEAAPLYRLAQQEWPHEKTLRQGLAAAEAALRKPRF